MRHHSIIEHLEALQCNRGIPYILAALKIEGFVGNIFWRRKPPLLKQPSLLHLGCGPIFYDDWLNADFYLFHKLYSGKRLPDWMLDASRLWNCSDDIFDGIFTEHTLEHLDYNGAINTLREAFRTLKPGRWLRISVPDLEKYLDFTLSQDFVEGNLKNNEFGQFKYKAEAVSNISQCWGHQSLWDSDMLCVLLSEIGFVNVKKVSFGDGQDERLIKDSVDRKWESLYVEAQKLEDK